MFKIAIIYNKISFIKKRYLNKEISFFAFIADFIYDNISWVYSFKINKIKKITILNLYFHVRKLELVTNIIFGV